MEQHWELGIWTPSPSLHLQHQQHPANLGPRVASGEGVLLRAGGCGALFLLGKIQLQYSPYSNGEYNTPAQGDVHSPGQWHRVWQGHRWYLGCIHAMCLSPPTATYSGQQSFPPFRVSGMWLEGLRPKGRYKPLSPHPPAPSRGPETGTIPGPLPPPWVGGPALVTSLCVPQPRRIIFQEFV